MTIADHADVAEWQTRSAQDAVGAILWRFKSSHPHQLLKVQPYLDRDILQRLLARPLI
jgi:hypothetical protein